MIVLTLGLEEDRVLRVPPKVCHGVAAVPATRQYFQAADALSVGARFPLLLLPRLRPEREKESRVSERRSERTGFWRVLRQIVAIAAQSCRFSAAESPDSSFESLAYFTWRLRFAIARASRRSYKRGLDHAVVE